MLDPVVASTRPANQLSRRADTSLTDQLAARFAARIREHTLAPGARLPSVRECARRHGVSVSTVVAAYDQLLALGLVEARKQRGFFVRDGTGAALQANLGGAARPTFAFNPTALIRGMLQPTGAHPMPGLGALPAEWLDLQLLASALRKVTSGASLGAVSLQYGEPAGDSVLVDEPGWSVEYARLAAFGVRVLAVPRGEEGPDLAVMERLIEAQPEGQKPRLYITVSVLHNPTGASLSLQSAHRVLQLAKAHDLHIVEDDTYSHFAPTHLPRLSALDGLERTVYLSSFSKILAPSWRVGFLAAPAGLVERLIDTKLLSTLTTPSLTEQAIAHGLELGLLRRHAERVTAKLDAARSRSVKLAEAHGCRLVAPPRGLFGWIDVGVDTERLAEPLLEAGWLIAPGAVFNATGRAGSLMRINFATSQDARFWAAMSRARDALRR